MLWRPNNDSFLVIFHLDRVCTYKLTLTEAMILQCHFSSTSEWKRWAISFNVNIKAQFFGIIIQICPMPGHTNKSQKCFSTILYISSPLLFTASGCHTTQVCTMHVDQRHKKDQDTYCDCSKSKLMSVETEFLEYHLFPILRVFFWVLSYNAVLGVSTDGANNITQYLLEIVCDVCWKRLSSECRHFSQFLKGKNRTENNMKWWATLNPTNSLWYIEEVYYGESVSLSDTDHRYRSHTYNIIPLFQTSLYPMTRAENNQSCLGAHWH